MLRKALWNDLIGSHRENSALHHNAFADSFAFDTERAPLIAIQAGQTHAAATSPSQAATSPSQAAEVTYISGISAGKIAATSFLTWHNDNPATYGSTSNGGKWGSATPGTVGGTVKYYFETASHWTATEKAQMTSCLSLWSAVANIQFTLTTNAAQAQITFHRGADSGAHTGGGLTGSGSPGHVGGTTMWNFTNPQTVSIDTSVPGFGPMDNNFHTAGGYVFGTIVHETGHGLGLGHGGPYDGNVNAMTQQFSIYDNQAWSIMSYIDPADAAKFKSQYPFSTSWSGGSPTTMMALDILAIQQIYGAPTASALSGNQTFGFNTNITGPIAEFFDFTINTAPVITIFSTGTGNTLDLSGYSTATTVDLNPGAFSSCAGLTNNLCIAYNTKIDSFVGTSANDKVTANTDADTIVTGSGNDSLDFGAALGKGDVVNGGSGKDTLFLEGNYTGASFAQAKLVNVETVSLGSGFDYSLSTTDKTVAAGHTLTINGSGLLAADILTFDGHAELDGSFVVTGGAANDSIIGGANADTINGGAGTNTVTGGGGADTISVASGKDTLVYGAVAESTSTNFDRIAKFDFSKNDHFNLNVGVTGIDATVATGTLSDSTFDTNLAKAITKTKMAAHDAVLFSPNVGDHAGDTFLIVDANGKAGYQAGADYVFEVTGALHITSIDATDFI